MYILAAFLQHNHPNVGDNADLYKMGPHSLGRFFGPELQPQDMRTFAQT